MMKFRRLAGVAALSLASAMASAQSFPEREITGVIQWAAGGTTDVAMRSLAPYAEEALGKKVVLQNKPGGVGVIGANFVLQQKPDGYTVLMGAGDPALYKVMGLANFDYGDFYPINIVSRTNVVLVARKDKPWTTLKDLLAEVQANPGKLKMYTAGTGTVPFTASTMVASVTKFPALPVPFDGDGPGITAILGGHIDFGFVGVSAVQEHIKSGRLKALGVLDDKPYGDIPPMTESVPELEKFAGWGPFFGVFVRNDVPEEIKQKLVAAFKTAADTPAHREQVGNRGNMMMNIAGDEAREFIRRWQSITAWVLPGRGRCQEGSGRAGHSPSLINGCKERCCICSAVAAVESGAPCKSHLNIL
ncbi:tripartite tricarboxylate transporter substrate binding protein [Thauera sp. SDU_THAU2]|uniref:tripartite tricarboxylate transporter substrate binding protein n=1 Tax=Thauera sp. SDU_THAU2 TaxID=3136633 RepID=UPI00311FA5C9